MRTTKNLFIAVIAALALSLTLANKSIAAPAVCPDQNFLKQVNTDLATLGGSPDYTKPDAIANSYITVATLRYKYEDATVPAGCEALQKTLVQILTLSGDSLLVKAAGLADPANAKTYDDYFTNVVTPRIKQASADLAVEFGTGAAAATATATPAQ